MRSPTPVPSVFTLKKAKILQNLSVPKTEYSDRSPKGSVDEGIRDLIDEINAYDGFVTTSSCAGRISVFQEGNGNPNESQNGGGDEVGRSSVPGGKGGGKSLFVSHEPVKVSQNGSDGLAHLSEILGPGDETTVVGYEASQSYVLGQKFVRFAFEPMILHIMTASLHHAKPLLSAAINSGFRESGVQSLKNLDDPNACPMVAVRTAGLGLEAIIASGIEEDEGGACRFCQLVPNDYAIMLLRIANERFDANQQRIEKFRFCLREAMALETQKVQRSENWETPEARRQWKRDEGLRAKEAVKFRVSEDTRFAALSSNDDDYGFLQLHPRD